MEAISVFDIFKIGVGPSSSHTLGPWNAALAFLKNIDVNVVDHIQIHLYGSLSKTGVGHATDKAVVLGLLGHLPQTFDTNLIEKTIIQVKENKTLEIESKKVRFDYKADIIFERYEHELHPNTLLFRAFTAGKIHKEQLFASVGGGFIESETQNEDEKSNIVCLLYTSPSPRDRG